MDMVVVVVALVHCATFFLADFVGFARLASLEFPFVVVVAFSEDRLRLSPILPC